MLMLHQTAGTLVQMWREEERLGTGLVTLLARCQPSRFKMALHSVVAADWQAMLPDPTFEDDLRPHLTRLRHAVHAMQVTLAALMTISHQLCNPTRLSVAGMSVFKHANHQVMSDWLLLSTLA